LSRPNKVMASTMRAAPTPSTPPPIIVGKQSNIGSVNSQGLPSDSDNNDNNASVIFVAPRHDVLCPSKPPSQDQGIKNRVLFEQFLSFMETRDSSLVDSSGTTVPRSGLPLAPPGLLIPSVNPPTPGQRSVFTEPRLDFSQMKSGDKRLSSIYSLTGNFFPRRNYFVLTIREDVLTKTDPRYLVPGAFTVGQVP